MSVSSKTFSPDCCARERAGAIATVAASLAGDLDRRRVLIAFGEELVGAGQVSLGGGDPGLEFIGRHGTDRDRHVGVAVQIVGVARWCLTAQLRALAVVDALALDQE